MKEPFVSTQLVFLKLGGSLITDKNRPFTIRQDILTRLVGEILSARESYPNLLLLLGHGSGSFGHTTAKKFGTRQGVKTREEWQGFAEVWKDARVLNQIVLESFLKAGMPVIAFPPSAAVTASAGRVLHWDIAPIKSALSAGMIPLVNGDTVFDDKLGGTILSTEDLFIYLAHHLHPHWIYLAGIEEGVWADFPTCTRLIRTITPDNLSHLLGSIGNSVSVDVTGGMLEKVLNIMNVVQNQPELQSLIFSGLVPGNVRDALLGSSLPGTLLSAGFLPD